MIQQGGEAPWRKATASQGNSNCVEVRAGAAGNIHVRNSRDPHGATLEFKPGEWDAFLNGAINGEFNRDALQQ
jgi:hypothetical protein